MRAASTTPELDAGAPKLAMALTVCIVSLFHGSANFASLGVPPFRNLGIGRRPRLRPRSSDLYSMLASAVNRNAKSS
jgi:hypothetical protein